MTDAQYNDENNWLQLITYVEEYLLDVHMSK